MPFEKGQSGNPKGRPKGTKNKFTSIKDSFLQAFQDIGGAEELAKWAKDKKNRGVFYTLTAKMLPKPIEQEVKGDIKVILKQFGNDK